MPDIVLKYRLMKSELALTFQILEQNMGERNAGVLYEPCDVRGLDVKSYSRPELGNFSIYVRGHTEKEDQFADYKLFVTNNARDHYFERAQAALLACASKFGANVRLDGGDGLYILIK